MKAQMSVDARLFRLLGQKLYSEHRIVIAGRELLQNSRDACIRKGVDPVISITVNYNSTADTAQLICEDNGIGMSEEDIVTKFLCLGATSKTGQKNETGRFGVAKVALMCGRSWYVHTRSSELDDVTVQDGNDISVSTEDRDGTLIDITYETVGHPYHWLQKLISMIAFSDVSVHFVYIRDTVTLIDEQLGMQVSQAPMIELIRRDSWVGYGTDHFSVNEYTITGYCFVRLNGLVQHARYKSYNEKMKGNLIVDLSSALSPDDESFPMTMSRERLTGTVETEVAEWHAFSSSNALSTDEIVRKAVVNPRTEFSPGKLMVGKRSRDGSIEKQAEEMSGNDRVETVKEWLGTAVWSRTLDGNTDLQDYIDPNSDFPIMRLFEYSPSDDQLLRDSRIIVAWGEILSLVLYEGFVFGVGLMGGPRVLSEITTVDGIPFFCINPSLLFKQPTEASTIMSMWAKACHEVAHLSRDAHDETFTTTLDFIIDGTIAGILLNISRLSKILQEKK